MGRDQRPTTEPWEALLRVHAAVVPVVAGDVEAATGLPLSWYDVLLELRRSDGWMLRMHALGQRVVLSRSRVSRIVDAMAEQGLVRREPDSNDGRATLAVATPKGKRALRRVAPIYLEAIERRFTKHLTDDEISAVTTALNRIVDRMEP